MSKAKPEPAPEVPPNPETPPVNPPPAPGGPGGPGVTPGKPPVDPLALLAQHGHMSGATVADGFRVYLKEKSSTLNTLPPEQQGAWRDVIADGLKLCEALEKQPSLLHAAADGLFRRQAEALEKTASKKVPGFDFKAFLLGDLAKYF